MKRIFTSKFLKTSLLFGGFTTYGLYLTDQLENANYLFGGLKRAGRCLSYGTHITIHYFRNGITDDSHEYAAKMLHEVFRKNLGCYIKLGQAICHMECIIPDPYVKELEPLCSECPTTDIEGVRKLLEKEYGKDITSIFKEIEPVPIGSASLAQVHRGVLMDGTKVAIKVQHANIPYNLKGDILTVQIGCYIAELIFPDFRYKWLGRELKTNLPEELDFRKEGKNADKLRELFKDDPRLVVPRIYWDLTTDKVLVMSFEEGKCVTDTNYMKENNIKIKEVSATICDLFNQQIFKHGFVHADPHQGNILVRKEKVNGSDMTRIVLLDHGLYLQYDEEFRYYCSLLWRGIITQNKEILKDACKKIGITKDDMFIKLITSNDYEEVMNENNKYNSDERFKIKKTEERSNTKKYDKQYHKDITHLLSGVRREMLTLLKINEFLRNIDSKIDSSLNYLEIMMKYIYTELEYFEKDFGRMHLIKLRIEYYKYILLFSGYRFFLYFFPETETEEDLILIESIAAKAKH